MPESEHPLALRGLVVFLVWNAVVALLAPPAATQGPAQIERQAYAALTAFAASMVCAGLLRFPHQWWCSEGAPRRLARALACYAAFLVGWVPLALIAYPALLERLGHGFPPQPALQYFAEAPASPLGFAAHSLVVVVCAPVFEELLFRGYLFTVVRRLLPAWAAIAAVAALFGLAHGAVYAFPTGLLGALFGWLRERSGGLWPSIAVHAVHNGLTIAIMVSHPELFRAVFR